LCNGILERWTQVKDTWSHEGMNEFVKEKREKGIYSKSLIDGGEIFGDGNTLDELMASWKGSPSHDQALLKTKFNEGCPYSWEGKTLIMLGVRK